MKVSFLGLDVDIPDDPVAFIKGKVVEILNWMGYEWPVTDTGVLDSWAGQWDSFQGEVQRHIAELEAGVRYLAGSNEGEVVDSVSAFMGSNESQIHSLSTVATAAPAAAFAYRAASLLVTGLRAYVIGQIMLDVVSLAAAIMTGGASAAVSFLAKQGVGMAINIAIDQAINSLLGA